MRTEQLMCMGGIIGLLLLLDVTLLLAWAGASWGEALYLSIVLAMSMMYLAFQVMTKGRK